MVRTGTSPEPGLDAERFALGIDVGTSAVKVSVMSSHGRHASFVSAGYAISSPAPGFAEQDPEDWWLGAGEALESALAAFPEVSGESAVVALTGQMHTTVLRDQEDALVRPAILWSDTRAREAAETLQTASAVPWMSVTGNRPIPAFTSAHLAWLGAHEPASLGRAVRVSVPKDDLRYRLGAGWATEPSDASAMNLMDYRSDQWRPELLEYLGVREDVLPPIVPSAQVTGRIRSLPPGGENIGRLLGAPVLAGAGDQAAQALALGVRKDGLLGLSVGTSGAALQASATPRPGSFRHALPGMWLSLDSMHAAGLALTWWADMAGIDFDGYSDIQAADVTAQSPMFLPYLQGARGGHHIPATLTDVRASHTKADITASVLEGVAIELVRLARGLSEQGIAPGTVRIGGRAGRLAALRQLIAEGLERPVAYSPGGSAAGAAILAAEASGWAPEPALEHGSTAHPSPEGSALFASRLNRYMHVLKALS